MKFNNTDLDELKIAKALLENPGLAAKMMDVLGKPIEAGFRRLPESINKYVSKATPKALLKAMDFAIITMDTSTQSSASNFLHKVAVAATGTVGGFFGLVALPVELPITTTFMMRSIMDIARSERENLNNIESRLACLEVFALGGGTTGDDASESGYFAIRSALAGAIKDAADHVAQKGLAEKGAPVLVRLITKIAQRFGIQVTEEAAATAIPIIGAASAGAINWIFIDHFQKMAKGHFIVRRLERKYDSDMVERIYLQL